MAPSNFRPLAGRVVWLVLVSDDHDPLDAPEVYVFATKTKATEYADYIHSLCLDADIQRHVVLKEKKP